MKKNVLIISLIAIITALISIFIIQNGLPWYKTLIVPDYIPPSNVSRLSWAIIYVLTTIGAITAWNKSKTKNQKTFLAALFFINIFLYITWLLGFFYFHLLEVALIHHLLLIISTIAIIVYFFSFSRIAAMLGLPYLLYIGYMQYIMYVVYTLNH